MFVVLFPADAAANISAFRTSTGFDLTGIEHPVGRSGSALYSQRKRQTGNRKKKKRAEAGGDSGFFWRPDLSFGFFAACFVENMRRRTPCRGDVTNTRRRSNRHERHLRAAETDDRRARRRRRCTLSPKIFCSPFPRLFFFCLFRVLLSSLFFSTDVIWLRTRGKEKRVPLTITPQNNTLFSPRRPSTGLLAT